MRTIASINLFLAALIALCCGPNAVSAHDGAQGVVQERMDLMKSIGQAMKDISKMARGKAPLENAKILEAAKTIAKHGDRIPYLFPTGSVSAPSGGSPEIWRNPDSFNKRAEDLVESANSLAAAAVANNLGKITETYRLLGKTCSGCHSQFRLKKK